MSTTDTRTGFRLPWSSDRSGQDQMQPDEGAAEATEVAAAAAESPAGDGAQDTHGWPDAEPVARATDESEGPAPTAPTPPPAPRKPSRLMADLTAAMRAAAEGARDQALAQLEGESTQVIEGISASATDGVATLRQNADEDIAGIRDWSKAEIARIRERTEGRISERKAELEAELAEHAGVIERRIELVKATVAAYETEMATFFEQLLEVTDPAHFAAMAETLPEPPSLEALAVANVPKPAPVEDEPEAVAPEPEPAEPVEVAEAIVETAEVADAHADDAEAQALAEAEATTEAGAVEAGTAVAGAEVEAEAGTAVAVAEPEPETAAEAETPSEAQAESETSAGSGMAWTDDEGSWTVRGTNESDDVPGGEPVDRGAIMAALEAAAEAVVAAESAAESASQAEVSAEVAETAAELIVGRVDSEGESADEEAWELDPEAQAALAARMDAFAPDASFADRLAGLSPQAESSSEVRTSQVVVAGLVSVASIASFKRHLGRIAGVQSVSVSSGPDGEFVFNATHRADVSFKDTIPGLPGFAARVTSVADGVVHVAARDPESEG